MTKNFTKNVNIFFWICALFRIFYTVGPINNKKWTILGGRAISNSIFLKQNLKKVYLFYHFFENFQNFFKKFTNRVHDFFQIICSCLIFTKLKKALESAFFWSDSKIIFILGKCLKEIAYSLFFSKIENFKVAKI